MTDLQIAGIPTSVDRVEVVAMLHWLKMDADQLVSFELKHHAIEAVVYALDADGHRYSADGETAARHVITIPIVDP